MREQIISCINREKLIAIFRGISSEKCGRVAQALYDGGIRLMEITYNQKRSDTWEETARVVGEIAKNFAGRMFVGAGTVTSEELVDLTFRRGGQFIVSPDINENVIRRTRSLGMVSIPGALTPSEIMEAHRAGADFVKLFPAGIFGSAYLKAIRAPISHVAILAVGGINENNIGAFIAEGAAGAGVSRGLVNNCSIENGEFEKITATARKLISAIRAAENKNRTR